MTSLGDFPITPGWVITKDEGWFTARRSTPLTDYQRLNGALMELDARDDGELWLLIDAQTRLAERLATAEMIWRAVQIVTELGTPNAG